MITLVLVTLEETCRGCPSQWEGMSSEGATFYARYRWGHWRVDIDGETVAEGDAGGEFAGVCSFEDITAWVRAANLTLIDESRLRDGERT